MIAAPSFLSSSDRSGSLGEKETAAQADAQSGRSRRVDWAARRRLGPRDRPSLGPHLSGILTETGSHRISRNGTATSGSAVQRIRATHARVRRGARWPSRGAIPCARPPARTSSSRAFSYSWMAGSWIGRWGLCRGRGGRFNTPFSTFVSLRLRSYGPPPCFAYFKFR